MFCDSLQRHDPTAVFGRTLLRSVFSVMRRKLLEKFRAEKDKMPPDKRTIVLTHFPRSVMCINLTVLFLVLLCQQCYYL